VGLFGKKTTHLLGVDISSTAVKLVELGRQGSGYRIESYAVEPLPPNAVVEKNISNLEAVSSAITSAIKRSQTKHREAAAAVPASSAISRSLVMDGNQSDEDMESQVNLQAEQYIPYPLEEVNLDFQVMGPAKGGGPDDVELLLVASRSENVETRVDALADGGLSAKLVDVESYALESAFELIAPGLPVGADATVAVVDIGAMMTTLTVLENGRIIYTRDQVFGGKQLTDEIMRRYSASNEEAERYKKQGGLPDSYEDETLPRFKDSLAQQVSRSLQFFFGASQHNSVDHIVLVGGCASIPGIAERIEEDTGTGTSVGNPFSDMPVASRIRPQALAEDAPALVIACGLALRSFD